MNKRSTVSEAEFAGDHLKNYAPPQRAAIYTIAFSSPGEERWNGLMFITAAAADDDDRNNTRTG